MRTKTPLILVLLALAAPLLYAHDLFVKLDTFFVEPNSSVVIPILNGTFQLSENSITRDRVPDISVVSPAGRERIDTTAWLAEGDTTFLTITTADPGTYVVGASTNPRDLGLDAADFNEYLAHDGIPDVLAARERDNELEKDVWERYSKHVKAVFRVGVPKRWWQFWRDKEGTEYQTVLGYPAEVIPLVSPYELEVGDEIEVRCMVDGAPAANQYVMIGGQAEDEVFEVRGSRTNDDGVVAFTLDSPGRYYIEFINMVPSPVEDIDYESKWATMTFELR
jgi:hypothetical protein